MRLYPAETSAKRFERNFGRHGEKTLFALARWENTFFYFCTLKSYATWPTKTKILSLITNLALPILSCWTYLIVFGLIQQANQIDAEKIWTEDLTQINAGMMVEQFVGQELLVYGEYYEEKQLFFWQREKQGSEAEVDYVIAMHGYIIPAEVKAGKQEGYVH